MPTTVKTGWLKDKNGDKFAPKTLTSQVQTSDGVLLEDKIQADITSAIDGKADKATTLSSYGITDAYTKSDVDTAVAQKTQVQFITWEAED